MNYRDDVTNWIFDQWQFILFVVGGAGAFWLGTKKSEWELKRAIKDIDELKKRVQVSERVQSKEAIDIGKMTVALENISHNQERILAEVASLQSGKADK